MKMPRVHDFDPNAQVPELASPLDHLPVIQPPTQKQSPYAIQQKTVQSPSSLLSQEQPVSSEPSNARTLERSHVRRTRRRASYELYTDQIEAIQRIALEEKLQGGAGNQSEMVREAIDAYLKKKREGK